MSTLRVLCNILVFTFLCAASSGEDCSWQPWGYGDLIRSKSCVRIFKRPCSCSSNPTCVGFDNIADDVEGSLNCSWTYTWCPEDPADHVKQSYRICGKLSSRVCIKKVDDKIRFCELWITKSEPQCFKDVTGPSFPVLNRFCSIKSGNSGSKLPTYLIAPIIVLIGAFFILIGRLCLCGRHTCRFTSNSHTNMAFDQVTTVSTSVPSAPAPNQSIEPPTYADVVNGKTNESLPSYNQAMTELPSSNDTIIGHSNIEDSSQQH